jgi:two-component system CheB/CheR fusion protein
MNNDGEMEKQFYNSDQTNAAYSVVGITASPTNLEGLEQFLDHMNADSGLAFLVAPYNSGKMITFPIESLAKHTSMKIFHAQDYMRIEPNCIYLLPPKKQLSIRTDTLHFTDFTLISDQNMPADRFLFTMAEVFGSKVISLLFAGGGTDGELGIEAIRQVNGIVMVEAKNSANSINLPANDLPSEHIDHLATPPEMGPIIVEYLTFYTYHTRVTAEEERNKLFSMLRQATDIDFSSYKQNSILRRIQRRMRIRGFHLLQEYNQYLMNHPEEITALQKDLLIGVTQFFRDPDAFTILAEKVIPAIFEQRSEEKRIRIWIAGCSTGEEVYSLAILFKRHMQEIGEEFEVKIFATDLDKESIQIASKGVYPEIISKSIPLDLLKSYFTPHNDKYHVHKELREMVVFAQHNILKDPPFIQLDLVTCRNMLIYLKPDMQRKAISLLHFALKSDGFLFLGPSETLGKLTNLFKSVDNKWNIYQYKEIKQWLNTNHFGMADDRNEKKKHKNKVIARLKETEQKIKQENIYNKLIEEYVPACIIIDENNEIIHINGNADKYLIIPKGKPSHNLFNMISEHLSVALGTSLYKVRKERLEVIYRDIIIKNHKEVYCVNLITKPFIIPPSNDNLTIIFFEEIEDGLDNEEQQIQQYFKLDSITNQHIENLKQQLFHMKESLQATIEELETSNEEFQATNEELIVANEELQSTNEELQSVNEELIAVNNEHHFKIQELSELNTDMSNLFMSTDIATIFLDTQMNIRRFTPMATEEINLMEFDVGRPLGDISHHLKYEHFVDDVAKVLLTANPFEKEIQSKTGKWFNVKIIPYLTKANLQDGVVITLMDITELKKANEELIILSYALEQSPGSVVITDMEQRITYINTKYIDQTGYTLDEVIFTKLELHSDQLSSEQLLDIWNQASMGKKWIGELQNKKKNGELFNEFVSMLPIKNNQGQIIRVLKISEDIVQQKQTMELLYKSEMLSVVGQLAAGIAHEIRNPLTALKGFTKLLEPTTDKKNYINIMSTELERIETIINELLFLARPQQQLFESKDVLTILQDVIMLLEAQATLNNVEIVTQFSVSIPLISCIENQLKQVFINIIKNGIEAMPYGGNLIIKVKIADKNSILISFTDQGDGIPEHNISMLGKPFYTTKEEGTGLGLMVSFKIIEYHRGKITIKSTVGKGTTFEIRLKTGHEDI